MGLNRRLGFCFFWVRPGAPVCPPGTRRQAGGARNELGEETKVGGNLLCPRVTVCTEGLELLTKSGNVARDRELEHQAPLLQNGLCLLVPVCRLRKLVQCRRKVLLTM